MRFLLAGLFLLAWAPTLTPMHRLWGFGLQTTLMGVIEGALLLITGAAIFRTAGERRRRWIDVIGVVVFSWLALTLLTMAIEPPRDRAAQARHVSAASSAQAQVAAQRRVLIVAVDGMDWRAIDQLIATGALPYVKELLANARTYQVDNHGLGLSPGIWARAYTGAAHEPIQGFTKWSIRGINRDVGVLPEWRHRPVFMLDRGLNAGAALHLWNAESPSNMDFVHPPLWRIASAAGRRVGVFDPLPFDVVGERVNGFFAWQSDEGFQIAVSRGTKSAIERVRVEPAADSLDGIIASEGFRASIAARAFARERPDIGIYYTHVLDAVGHMIWEPGAASNAADVRAERSRPLAAGRVAAVYRAIDASLKTLSEGFGGPAVIVLISDHGWEFSVYAHRTAPFGVAAVAGVGARGFGGKMPVESLAATVLAIAQVPVPATIASPMRDVVPEWATCTDCAAAEGSFISSPAGDTDRRNRLRSLGYTTR